MTMITPRVAAQLAGPELIAIHITGLGPCLPNNLSTYGARRFHISRSEWDRVFSRLTVVPGFSSSKHEPGMQHEDFPGGHPS